MFRERKTIMKNTILRNSIVILTVILLPALIGAAQAGAVEYKNSYQQSVVSHHLSAVGYQGTTAPSAAFQSTSAYSSQWSEESSSTLLNSDGSVNSGAYMSSGPRRAKMDDVLPPNPDVDEGDSGNVPLGEGLLALMFLACAYAISKVSRRRRILRG
jgi:hypothetical protein